jgi:hypothetical protein
MNLVYINQIFRPPTDDNLKEFEELPAHAVHGSTTHGIYMDIDKTPTASPVLANNHIHSNAGNGIAYYTPGSFGLGKC